VPHPSAGGVASKTTATASGYSARAEVKQYGGSGGYGAGGAKGGAGAASTLTNAVSGSTTGGASSYLRLYQSATGGAGGQSNPSTGGVGGAATSNLTFDDTKNTKHAHSVTGFAGAYGGTGGNGGTGGAGGASTASLTLPGAFGAAAAVTATGGGGAGALGGNATATSDAIGTTTITSNATATGGTGGAGVGTASATATGQSSHGGTVSSAAIGNGSSGTADSNASTSLTGSLVTAASANAHAPVAGTSTALTWAAIGLGAISAPGFVADQAEAQLTAEPTSGDVNSILASNSNINTAFTAKTSPVYFGIGELGGAYSTSGSGSETETSSVHMTVDLTKLVSLHDLLIGFYSGTSAGAGFTSMSLDVKIDGTDHVTNFATVAAANSFFNNSGNGNAVDYGALSGTSLQLDISLSITDSAAGGYDFGMLIGDPPPAQHSNALAALGHASASFTSGAGGNVGGSDPAQQDNNTLQLANPSHAVT
jgi:hypothetical protein